MSTFKGPDDSELLYTTRVNIEEVFGKAAQMCNEGKKKSLNVRNILKQAESRLNKLHATDKEMASALSVITSILSELSGRKIELEEYMRNAKRPAEVKQLLQKVLEELKAEKVSKKFAGFFEGIPATIDRKTYAFVLPKYETLYDYVNEENVKRVTSEADGLFQGVESANYALGINFAFLIESIEKPIEELTMAGSMIDTTYNLLQEHQKKIADYLFQIEKYVNEVKTQHERLRKIAAFRVLSKNSPVPLPVTPDKVFKAEEENSILAMNNENLIHIDKVLGEIKSNEEIVMQEYAYYEDYVRKKIKSYQNLMNVPRKAKEELQIIEEKFKEFEEQWEKSQEKVGELEKLANCYAKFKISYQNALVELKRRLQYEIEIEKQAREFKETLVNKYNEEVKQRHKFNAGVIKYLPASFCPVLTMNPAKYDVVCAQSVTLLSEISDQDLSGGKGGDSGEGVPKNLYIQEKSEEGKKGDKK